MAIVVVDAIFGLFDAVSVVAIFVVAGMKKEVTIFRMACLVHIVAIFYLAIDRSIEVRAFHIHFVHLFKKRRIVSVFLSMLQRIMRISEVAFQAQHFPRIIGSNI